jgi:hypothetical protein
MDKGAGMIRKLVTTTAVVALSVGTMATLAVVTGVGVASAKAPVVAHVTCSLTGTVNFTNGGASGGISQYGTVDLNKKITTVATETASGPPACPTAPSVINITSKSGKCKALPNLPSPITAPILGSINLALTKFPGQNLPVCIADNLSKTKGYFYNTAWTFVGSGASTIGTALKHGISFIDNGVPLTLLITSSTGVAPGGVCGSGTGFAITGTVKKTTDTWSSAVCFTGDTGTLTTNNFEGDIAGQLLASTTALGGPAPDPHTVIATALIGGLSNLVVN